MVRNVKTRKGGVYQSTSAAGDVAEDSKKRKNDEDGEEGFKKARGEEDDAVRGKEATAVELLATNMASQHAEEDDEEDEEDLVPQATLLDEDDEEEDLVGAVPPQTTMDGLPKKKLVAAAATGAHLAAAAAAAAAVAAAIQQPIQPVQSQMGDMTVVQQPPPPQSEQPQHHSQYENENERKRKETKEKKRQEEDQVLSHPWAQLLMAKDAGYSRRETLATFAGYRQDPDDLKLCVTLFLQLAPLAGRYDQKDTESVMDRISRENERGGPDLKKLVALHNILNLGSMAADWVTEEPDFLHRVLNVLETPNPADSHYKYHQAIQVLTFAYRKNYERSRQPNGPPLLLSSGTLSQSRNSKTNQALPDGFWIVQSVLNGLKLQQHLMQSGSQDKARMFTQGVAASLCDLLDLVAQVFGRDHLSCIMRLLPSSTAATRELLLQFCKQDVVECVRSHVANHEFDKLVRGNHHIRSDTKNLSVSV